MQFVYPAFLFALAALAIPIIIHLFHFRRFKRVYFSNVRFLREVKDETSSRSRLRNLLVLLSRLLALAFLVLLFAQPFIPLGQEAQKGARDVSIFVDNSFSMSALSRDLALLEQAKRRAREIVNAYRPEDRFQVLTHDFEGRHQRLVSQEEALDYIGEIPITPVVRPLSEVLSRQKQVFELGNLPNKEAYLISDFQRSITDLEADMLDTSLALTLIPLQAVQERNISLDSIWFEAPVQMLGANSTLLVQVSNRTDESVENIRLSLDYGGQDKPVASLSIPAGGTLVDTVFLTPARTGWQRASLSITDFPVQFDDTLYLAFQVPAEVRVLSIYEEEPNAFVKAAIGGMRGFAHTAQNSNSLNYTQFDRYNLIVLEDLVSLSSGLGSALTRYLRNGGNVLVFPARNADLAAYNSFLNGLSAASLRNFQTQPQQVGEINTEEFVFQDVFEKLDKNLRLPKTQGSFRADQAPGEVLLRYRSGAPFLQKFRRELGNLYLCLAPVDSDLNDLVRNGEIFIPMLYKMAISANRDQQVAYTLGSDAVISLAHEVEDPNLLYRIRGEGQELIPEQRTVGNRAYFSMPAQVRRAGFFEVFLSADTTLRVLAFNYDRRESDLTYFNAEDLEDRLGERAEVLALSDNSVLTGKIQQQSRGVQLWKWCLLLALLFLGIEILLLRFWKV